MIDYTDMASVREHMGKLTADGVLQDIDTALQFLSETGIGPANVGVVGFCMGGTVALVTAARRTVGAAVTFYGGGVTEGRFGFDPLTEEAAQLKARGSDSSATSTPACPWLTWSNCDEQPNPRGSQPRSSVIQMQAMASTATSETATTTSRHATHGPNRSTGPTATSRADRLPLSNVADDLGLTVDLYYGRVAPEEAVRLAGELSDGLIDLDHYRGRSCFGPLAQAAEVFARRELGERRLHGLRTRSVGRRGDDALAVHFDHDGGPLEVVVRRERAEPDLLTCGAAPARPWRYVLESITGR